MKKKSRLLILICICVMFFTSCEQKKPMLEDFAEYSNYLKNGDLDGVKKYYKKFGKYALLEYGVEGLYKVNPLESSILYKYPEITEFLLKKGADPNALSSYGNNPLIFTAVIGENLDAIKILIEHDVDVNFFSYQDGTSFLSNVLMTGNLEMLMIVFDKIKDINIENPDGSNSLFSAVLSGNLSCVKFLIDNSINVNKKTYSDNTALMYAVFSERIDIAEYLIQNGADISIKNNEGLDAKWFADELGLSIKGLTY